MARKLNPSEEHDFSDALSCRDCLPPADSADNEQLIHGMVEKRDTELQLTPELHAFWELPQPFLRR